VLLTSREAPSTIPCHIWCHPPTWEVADGKSTSNVEAAGHGLGPDGEGRLEGITLAPASTKDGVGLASILATVGNDKVES
jgi:hypothetical protein